MTKQTIYKIANYELKRVVMLTQRDDEIYIVISKDGKEVVKISWHHLQDLLESLEDMQKDFS